MKKRWVIRGFFISLLTLCVFAWMGSYWQECDLGYVGHSWCVWLVTDRGVVSVSVEYGHQEPPKWFFLHYDHPLPGFLQIVDGPWGAGYQTSAYHFMGFAYTSFRPTSNLWAVWVPFWFPTFLSALTLWRVWQPKRGRPLAPPADTAAAESATTAGTFRRWLLRGLALALLALCVVPWVWFSWAAAHVRYDTGRSLAYDVDVGEGRLWLDRFNWSLGPAGWDSWFFPHMPRSIQSSEGWLVWDRHALFHFAGFSLGNGFNDRTWISIPLWFFSALAAGFAWLVWRRTKPGIFSARGAFPLEPSAAKAT